MDNILDYKLSTLNTDFYICLFSYPDWNSLFLHMVSYRLLKWSLISTQKTPFTISFTVYLLVMNSLSFRLSGNALISPLFLKDSFARLTGLFVFFFLSALNISSYCLLGIIVSSEKWAVNLFEEPLYMASYRPLASLKFLCLCL